MEDETRETVTTGTGNPCGCCGEAHPECDCGEHIAVDPCLPVENTKTKVVQHADNVEQACRVCHADNVGTLYEGIQSLEAGRLIRIDGTNRISVTLTAGDGIAIDEDTGKISSTMRSLEAGRLTKITQDGKVSSTLQAGSNMSLEGDTMNCTLRAGKNTSISETGNIDCALEAGDLMEITEDGTMNVTLTAGDGITIEGDNIKAPNGYGLRYSNNKLSLYVLSGKGIKNKSQGSQNLGGFAYMPELDIEGGARNNNRQQREHSNHIYGNTAGQGLPFRPSRQRERQRHGHILPL